MKLAISSRPQSGSIMIITVFMCAIIGIVLASYLDLVQAQNLAVSRSQTWNSAIPSAEAGIEEALAHLNNCGTNNWGTNGWSFNGTNYVMSRTVGDLSYSVSISSNSAPAIESTGFAVLPLKGTTISRTVRVTTSRQGSGYKGMVAKGGISLGPGSEADSYDSRISGVYSTGGKRDNGFVGSVGATVTGGTIWGIVGTGPTGATPTSKVGDFTWTGSGIQTGHYENDLNLSFPDVTVPSGTWFTGLPSGGTVTNTTLIVSTNSYTTNTYPGAGVTVTSTNVGALTGNQYWQMVSGTLTYFSTVPTNATVTSTTYPSENGQFKNSAFPGTLTYIPGYYGSGVDSRTSGSTRYWIPYRIAAYSGTNYTYQTTAASNVTTTATYDYIFNNANYEVASLSFHGQTSILVMGDVKIHSTGSIDLGGNAYIYMASGATLEIYADDSVKIAGNGIVNSSGDALSCAIYGTSTCDEIKIAGNGDYTGIIYAPYATLKGAGGGSDSLDLKGAAIVGEVNFNGHFSFHYDERLGDEGGVVQFVISSWNEL